MFAHSRGSCFSLFKTGVGQLCGEARRGWDSQCTDVHAWPVCKQEDRRGSILTDRERCVMWRSASEEITPPGLPISMTLYLTMMKTVYWPFDNTSPEPSQRGKVSSTQEEVSSQSRSLQTPLPWLKASRRNIIPQKRTEFTLYRGLMVFPDGVPPPRVCVCVDGCWTLFVCVRAIRTGIEPVFGACSAQKRCALFETSSVSVSQQSKAALR